MASKLFTQFKGKVKKIIPIKSKRKLEDYYDLKDTLLGTGTYSTVRLAVSRKTLEECALKIVHKDSLQDLDRDDIMMEIDLMRTYGDHPNILQLIEVFEDRKRIILVLELMHGGDLLTRLQKRKFYSEKDAATVFKRILSAVSWLHKNGVVHRDLKLDNILFANDTEEDLRLADFGFARYVGDGTLIDSCGSPVYVAPEIVKNQEYGKEVDMWSLGIILYILLCGFPPFYHERPENIFPQIERGTFDFPDPYWTKISSSAKDLVSQLIKVDPKERLTSEKALQHNWFQDFSDTPHKRNENEAITV